LQKTKTFMLQMSATCIPSDQIFLEFGFFILGV
jgi:hypothetical protein